MPAFSACARSMREQKPWIVEIQALSAARASSRRPRSRKRRRTRLRISAAAFSVNVIASTCSTADAVLDHRAHEALHEHGRLARARARAHEQRPVAAARPRARCSGVSRLTARSCRSRGTSSRRSRRSCRAREQSSPARIRARRSRGSAPAPSRASASNSSARQPVVGDPARAEPVHVLRAPSRAGAASSPPSAHVHAARGLEPEQLATAEHVERRLEAVLLLPAGHLVAVHALARSCSRPRAPGRRTCPRGRSGRARAARPSSSTGSLPSRAERELQLRSARTARPSPPRERRKRSRSNSSRRTAARTRVCLGESRKLERRSRSSSSRIRSACGEVRRASRAASRSLAEARVGVLEHLVGVAAAHHRLGSGSSASGPQQVLHEPLHRAVGEVLERARRDGVARRQLREQRLRA